MSEPPHQVEYDFDYWMNTDLMDACLDPMHDSMGPNGRRKVDEGGCVARSNPAAGENVDQPSPDELDRLANLSGFQSTSLAFDLTPSLDEGDHRLFESEGASMNELQHVSATQVQDNAKYACQTCGASFESQWDLGRHAKKSGHLIFSCSFSGCSQKFVSSEEKWAHERRPHTSGHSRTVTAAPFDCVECGESLSSKANLLRHAKEKQHQPYACECGAVFSRLDVLNRHLESVGTEIPKYPCKLCKRHRGANGFRRLDHLRQHERNYHHLEMDHDSAKALESRLKYYFPVCSHSDCTYYRDESFKTLPRSTQEAIKPFSTQSAFTKHMREAHNECTFPCDVQGCDRIGRRGYFREKDMMKHRRESHPDAPLYQPTKRELKIRCTESGCSAVLETSSIFYHIWVHDWKKRQNSTNQAVDSHLPSTAAQTQPTDGGSNSTGFECALGNEQSSGF